MAETSVVVEGLAFPEGPRWHDGRLWFSDMHAYRVKSVNVSRQAVRDEFEVPKRPSGLGWDPEGRLMVVSMEDRRLLRADADGSLVDYADFAHLVDRNCNDMVVDAAGRAYVGSFGFDLHGHEEPRSTVLLMVAPDGLPHVVADDMLFPNGMVITPDGSTLIVGESFGARLTAFTIEADGSLTDRRVWAQFQGEVPDGICLDAEGAVWAASPVTNEVLRVREGGEVIQRISTGDRGAYACMLGGTDRKTLFICTSAVSDPAECETEHTGRIEAVKVEVPGAGLP